MSRDVVIIRARSRRSVAAVRGVAVAAWALAACSQPAQPVPTHEAPPPPPTFAASIPISPPATAMPVQLRPPTRTPCPPGNPIRTPPQALPPFPECP